MQKDQILDLILFVQLKLRISMYVNYVKSDFVVFFCQDKDIIGIHYITKTGLYNFDPLEPHFYIVKLGFTRGMRYFSYFCSKHRLRVLVRTASPRRF